MHPSYEEQKERFCFVQKASHHVPPHLHNAIEFVYVLRGELDLGIGCELYHMEKGDFAAVFPDLIHHYQIFSGKEGMAWYLYAAPELSGSFLEQLQKKCPEDPVIPRANLHYEIRNAFICLSKDKNVNDITGQAYTQIILYRCIQEYRLTEKENIGSHDLIYDTMSYLFSHFQEELTLSSVAEALGVNKYTLSKVFSGTFHTNFSQYLNEIRLNYAASLLESTDRTITDIYLEAGFESQRTFNRTFLHKYNRTPSEYRKMSVYPL